MRRDPRTDSQSRPCHPFRPTPSICGWALITPMVTWVSEFSTLLLCSERDGCLANGGAPLQNQENNGLPTDETYFKSGIGVAKSKNSSWVLLIEIFDSVVYFLKFSLYIMHLPISAT
ncbi:hypothetical protein AVEN_196440-1 [Araneus ventricosus]|uniref:Uncharacterized protein n=1 Tax=Araneus ventricosus TaxID=182803 RepID=A0A4Y2AVS2_ARAVE|nr:hypothetical protein AVEN_196440-1 [Araneus ventricosus]